MRELKQDWRDIFLAFRIARDPRKVLLGAAGVILSLVFVLVLTWALHGINVIREGSTKEVIQENALRFLANPVSAVKNGVKVFHVPKKRENPTTHKEEVVHRTPKPRAYISIALLAIGLLLIWSYFGGAISRIAAVELARDERIELREARKFACHKYWAYLWAPIVPAIGVLLFGLANLLGGLIGCIPLFGEFFMGIFFPLALLAGFLIALIIIGGAAGGGLMMPAISAEGTDAFDGISRAYSYVYSRPWRFIWYSLVALGYGLLCAIFVYCFTWLTVQAALATGGIGLKAIYGGFKFEAIRHFYSTWSFYRPEDPREQIHWWTQVGAFLVGVWAHLLWALFLGFAFSMIATCRTIIYFLMRKAVDGTEMTEVFMEEQEEAVEGAEASAEDKAEAEVPATEGEEAGKKRPSRRKKEEPKKEEPKKEEGKEESKEEGKEQGSES
jgi:hypothetical protein